MWISVVQVLLDSHAAWYRKQRCSDPFEAVLGLNTVKRAALLPAMQRVIGETAALSSLSATLDFLMQATGCRLQGFKKRDMSCNRWKRQGSLAQRIVCPAPMPIALLCRYSLKFRQPCLCCLWLAFLAHSLLCMILSYMVMAPRQAISRLQASKHAQHMQCARDDYRLS